jgi:hypothetical protein
MSSVLKGTSCIESGFVSFHADGQSEATKHTASRLLHAVTVLALPQKTILGLNTSTQAKTSSIGIAKRLPTMLMGQERGAMDVLIT